MESLVAQLASPFALFIVFMVAVAFAGAMTAVLLYHWKNYGVSQAGIARMKRVHFAVTGALIVAMAGGLLFTL